MTLLLTLLNKREVATAKFAGTTKLFYSQAMNGDLVYTSGKKTIWAAISRGILLIPFLMRMFPHLCCLNWRWHDYLPFGKLPLTAVTRNKLCNTARWSGYICLSILNYIFSLHISTILSGWGDLIGSVLQCNKLTLLISGEKQIRVCKWCACLGSESESERDKEEMEE